MQKKLEGMFKDVRRFILTKGQNMMEVFRKNPLRDDITMRFDYAAEKVAIDYCKKNFSFPVRILSEERGEILTKRGEPECTMMIDPVDGSKNFKKGIECSAFSVAVIPGDEKVIPKNVTHALVGNIFTGSVFYAEKGMGASYNWKKIRSSNETDLKNAVIGVDLYFYDPEKVNRIGSLLKSIKHARRIGAASYELSLVARGGYDGYVDVRNVLGPENFMAAYLIIKEAGGIFTDPFGKEIGEVDMTKQYNLIAAGNVILHKKLMSLIEW